MRALIGALRQHLAALRLLLAFTVICGIAYPLVITGIAQLPGLNDHANGSPIRQDGRVIGSSLIGQRFTDSNGNPLPQYFQPRPSAAGSGYDPTVSGASNLGPESIVDRLPNPKDKGETGRQSLLTQVCSRSLAIGKLDDVNGSRPFCTRDGVGAVLAVFWSGPGYHGHITRVVSVNQQCPAKPFLASYHGVPVRCGQYARNYSTGQIVPIRGNAPAHPTVPSDAVTASGSGLDPDISPAYAKTQEARIAKIRNITIAQISALVARYTSGRGLGFLGGPTVNVVQLNLALDHAYPYRP